MIFRKTEKQIGGRGLLAAVYGISFTIIWAHGSSGIIALPFDSLGFSGRRPTGTKATPKAPDFTQIKR